MSDNPFADPPPSNVPPPGIGGPDPQRAMSKVTPPAIGLIVVGVLNLLLALWGVASSAMFMAGLGPAIAAQQQQAEQMQELREQGMETLVRIIETMTQVQGPVGLVLSIVQLAAAGLIIFGGLKMKNLQSYGLSLTAAIVAMIPILSNCCCAGLPLGIWAIIVLMDNNVQQSFK